MKLPVLVCKWLPANGMALFPFILVKKPDYKHDFELLNHEKIHLVQQIELLILPFYVFYLLNYLVNRFKFKNHFDAYYHIVFEKEAYKNEGDKTYLQKREWFAWISYL